MKKFLAKLFGVSGAVGGQGARGAGINYKGCTIYPWVREEGGQWRIAGVISKQLGDETLEHNFIRADLLTSRDEAEAFAVRKGKQILDERGDRIFENAGQAKHG